MNYSAADRAFDAWREMTDRAEEPAPWTKEAEYLLRAAELVEVSARTRVARAVSLGLGPDERTKARALLDHATAVHDALAKRRHAGAITAPEMRKASAILVKLQAGTITQAAVTRSERARVARAGRRHAAVEAELEATGSVANMVDALVRALCAETHRAAALAKRQGALDRWLGTTNQLWGQACRAVDAFQERRDAGVEVTNGEWTAATRDLAAVREGLDDIEMRLRRGW